MQHVAIIMDGNRRWARNNTLQAGFMGHEKGIEPVKKSVAWCLEQKISYLSLYAFSLENIHRSEEEKAALFSLLTRALEQETENLISKGVSVHFIGDRMLIPEYLLDQINAIEKVTAKGKALVVQVMFFYGGQQELVYAAKSLAQKVKEGSLALDAITTETMKNELWTAGVPDPDMVIRAGGQVRLSNFLLFQSAYSEWFFLDTLWPDFNEEHLNQCAEKFNHMKRNFGQ